MDHPKISGEITAQSAITEVAAMMGENVKLSGGCTISSPVLCTYLHTSPQPGIGRIAGLLSLEIEDKNAPLSAVERVGSKLAMHVVAAKPLFLTKDDVSSDALENECEVLRSQAYDQWGNVICHGDKGVIREGHKSFPSGHTSWSFAGLGFLSLYLSGKIKAFDRQGHVAKLCLVVLPLLAASLVGVSRVDDYWHHWQDVFAGGLLGFVVATFCYLQFFPPPYHADGRKYREVSDGH